MFFAAQFWLFNFQKWLEKQKFIFYYFSFRFWLLWEFPRGRINSGRSCLRKILALIDNFFRIFSWYIFLESNFDSLISKNTRKNTSIFGHFPFWFLLLWEFPRGRVNFGLAIFAENFGCLIDNFVGENFGNITFFCSPNLIS